MGARATNARLVSSRTLRAQNLVAKLPSSGVGQDVTVKIAYVLAKTKQNARAEKLVDQLNRERPVDTLLQQNALPTIRAVIELNNNRADRALALLQPALAFERAVGSIGGLQPAYVRGLAYLQAKKGIEAAAEFQKLIDHPGVVEFMPTGALARLQLARANELQGDREAARRYCQDFLALWKDADPDIPILREAKAEYVRLK